MQIQRQKDPKLSRSTGRTKSWGGGNFPKSMHYLLDFLWGRPEISVTVQGKIDGAKLVRSENSAPKAGGQVKFGGKIHSGGGRARSRCLYSYMTLVKAYLKGVGKLELGRKEDRFWGNKTPPTPPPPQNKWNGLNEEDTSIPKDIGKEGGGLFSLFRAFIRKQSRTVGWEWETKSLDRKTKALLLAVERKFSD